MSSVDILNTEFGWVNREDGTPIPTPIDFSPPSFTNVPGVKTTIPAGTILAGKSFNGFDVLVKVEMADPVPFVQVNVQELKNYNQGYIEVPYVGESGGRHLYQIDSTFAPFADGVVLDVAADATVVAEIVTSSYPSQAIMPINFKCEFLALVEGGGVPPSDCFWTDLVGVSQDCGGDNPPEPPANFIFHQVPGGTTKVCVGTVANLGEGVYSSVLFQTNPEITLMEFSSETEGGDPLVGSGMFDTLSHCTMSETTVYALSSNTGSLLMKAIPYADFKGNFTSYTCDVDVGAAIGFNGSQDSVVGIEWWSAEGSVFMLVRKGATGGIQIWAKYDGADLATGWQLQGTMPPPASGSLSDNKLYYDPQLTSVVLMNNNGQPGSNNIWWAHTIGRGGGVSRPNGYATIITVTGGEMYWDGNHQFWQTNSGETFLVGKDQNGYLAQITFDGTVTPLFTEVEVADFATFTDNGSGDTDLGSCLFIAPRTDCSGTDVFGFLWNYQADRADTNVNMAYVGCKTLASAPKLKRVFGSLPNQCI